MARMIFSLLLILAPNLHAFQAEPATKSATHDVGFIGLHGGVYPKIENYAKNLGLTVRYFDDGELGGSKANLGSVSVLYIQHTRSEDREAYRDLLQRAKRDNPQLKIIAFQPSTADFFRTLAIESVLENDREAAGYYGSSDENLRRLLIYTGVKYLERDWKLEPPEEVDQSGLYHPDSQERFKTTEQFLVWARARRQINSDQPRLLIAVHAAHLAFQQPSVVDALIREAERQGAVAVAIVDGRAKDYEANAIAFAPHAVIHTCHSTDSLDFRLRLDVPHLHSIFMRKQAIDRWQTSLDGLSSSELAFHVIGQELIGAIEPQVAAGTSNGLGGSEALQPIPDRVTHLIARALSHARLALLPNSEKRIAVIYYDREMGKGELMRGSATGMHMNGPRSLVKVLSALQSRGFQVNPTPASEDELLSWMIDRGRQVGVWAPAELDRLARTGEPALIPEEQYLAWYRARVPIDRQKQMEEKWGPPPGRFMVWENSGKNYLVIPKIQLGNLLLMPQPLRGELHGNESMSSQTHDKVTTPPHNYLATYFWLQEQFDANAVIHFGTHGSEFALPGKPNGLSQHDWPDILIGTMPNFNPWIIENMVESSPVRRRVYGTLIDHLPPPIVNAGLSDELANLHELIDKWATMEQGSLKEKFRSEISKQTRNCRLDIDLHLQTTGAAALTDDEIEKVGDYLHDLQEETTPTSLHVFGEPPREDLLVPYLVEILRSPFMSAVQRLLKTDGVPTPATATTTDHEVRPTAELMVKLATIDNVEPLDAVQIALGRKVDSIPEEIEKGLKLAKQMRDQFRQTPQEISNLVRGLEGKFIPPGPGNSPIRNPNAVPTGRNMYLLNPEEVPTRPSWELGVKLAKELITNHQQTHAEFPKKIGFDLRSSATFRDYGVMEAQILYLMGIEPVWDERNLVNDLRLIPREELGRPRIDVFIAAGNWYESNLPSRLQLWDKAVQLVADADEADNPFRLNNESVRKQLVSNGIADELAARLSRGRIYGVAPGNESGSFLGYRVARSGDWETRDDIANEYLNSHKYIYTQGAWGEKAEAAYDQTIQGTHTIVRSWSDHMTGPLASKYTWLHGGSLSLAVEKMTGKRPDFVFSDVRDPDNAGMINAEDALRREFRVRLFNRKWLEGMMKEGYAGADHIRVMTSNSFAWEVMRPGSVGQDNWQEMKNVLVDDKLNLGLRDWFDKNNPYAYQDSLAVMLESIRKGYWQADEDTVRAIVREYAQNVALHGMSGHMTSGGNAQLDELVRRQINSLPDPNRAEILASYTAKINEQTKPAPSVDVATTPTAPTETSVTLASESAPKSLLDPSQDTTTKSVESASTAAQLVEVTGQQLQETPAESLESQDDFVPIALLSILVALFFALGFFVLPRQ